MIGANGVDSCGGAATMLRPRRLAEEAQGRPAESEAICGMKQRCFTNFLNQKMIGRSNKLTENIRLARFLHKLINRKREAKPKLS